MTKNKLNNRWIKYLSILEIMPLIVFILVRIFHLDMPQRIFIGGGLSMLVFGLYSSRLNVSRNIKFTPLYFGTNLFFVIVSAILILPLTSLQIFLLDLREAGMFLAIVIVGFVWQYMSPAGLFPPAEVLPESKKYSWILLGIYALSPVIALYFKGNEDLAGALPFTIIIVTEKVLNYFRTREMKRNLEYVR